MSDLGDMYAAIRERNKERKQNNYQHAIKKLDEAKIPYQNFNSGIHLKLAGYDYWPSTGVIMKNGRHIGRGIKKMLKLAQNGQQTTNKG